MHSRHITKKQTADDSNKQAKFLRNKLAKQSTHNATPQQQKQMTNLGKT